VAAAVAAAVEFILFPLFLASWWRPRVITCM
jgi:hypothetical protein